MCETNGRTPIETDLNRQSTNSTMTTISSSNDIQTPQSILASRSTLGQSTAPTTSKQNRVTFADDLTTSYHLSDSILETHILEEDDLESVVSDRDSFYQVTTALFSFLLAKLNDISDSLIFRCNFEFHFIYSYEQSTIV